jgi:DNA polymerase zeta
MKRNPLSENSQYVRAVIIVKGVHFYGFHASYSPFLKILMIDPALVSRAATIMQSGTIMHTQFRIFESHLSYVLQFMCDFGLYGCGWIDLGEVWQRGNVLEDDGEGEPSMFKPSLQFCESRMVLEVDVASHQILNRHILIARNSHHKLEILATPLTPEPLVPSVRELWEDERSRRRANGLPPSPDIPIDLSANSRRPGGGWAAEARWWDEIRKRIEKERAFQNEINGDGKDWEKGVMTAFESVEALWEDPWKVWKPEALGGRSDRKDREENPFGAASNKPDGEAEDDVDVNETILQSQEMNRLVELEEADWERLFEHNGLVNGENDEWGLDEEEPLGPADGVTSDSPHGSPHIRTSGNLTIAAGYEIYDRFRNVKLTEKE